MASTVWVVTGANRGIGLEFVKQILDLPNTTVIAGARSPEKAADLQKLSQQFEGRLFAVPLDLSDSNTVQAVVETVKKSHKDGVDFLINNAGVLGTFAQIKDQDLEDLKHVLLTNVVGTFAVTKAFLPLLKSGKKRTIINMSSDAGCLTQNASFIHDDRPSDAGMALSYRASKVAVNMETTVLANDLKKDDFKVVSLHPGFVATDMGANASDLMSAIRPGYGPTLTTGQSVQAMMKLIMALTQTQTGKYLLYDGSEMPW
ncbi:hypothetical protein WJX79_006992 [Trebouxia sp. C0005]